MATGGEQRATAARGEQREPRPLSKPLVRYEIEPSERESERAWTVLARISGEDIGRLAALVEEAKVGMNYVPLRTEQRSQ